MTARLTPTLDGHQSPSVGAEAERPALAVAARQPLHPGNPCAVRRELADMDRGLDRHEVVGEVGALDVGAELDDVVG
jgi:hypothetical protein